MSEASQGGRLAWPPAKEDLERLYLDQKLSAAKIATVYGLKYKNAKVAESTVLYELKKNGIKRRDRADHVRKVTEAMVDEWVSRYKAGESLKNIAREKFSPVTVFQHMRKRGVQLRDKVEAQIQAVTKYERKPFRGDSIEKAYLMGLRYGDLHVVRHGRAIRVRVSTTHPAMAELFENIFSPYAHVSWYPREAKLTGYEWTLECDLDVTFDFLLTKPTVEELVALSSQEMIAFLAGLFDAEGSIYLHDKRGRHNPEASFSGTEENMMEFVRRAIEILGFHCRLGWVIQKAHRQGVEGYSREGHVVLWRFHDVQAFLRILPIKHCEKVAKNQLVQKMEYRSETSENLKSQRVWEMLNVSIKIDRMEFIDLASKALEYGKVLENSLS